MATLATLVVRLGMNAGEFFGEMDKAESRTSKLIGGIGKNMQTLGTVALGGLGVAAGAATGVGVALTKLAVDAAPIKGVKDSFEGLTATVEGGSAGMLAALEEGSVGMIAQRDLMMKFNKAAGLVSTDFAVQLPEAMQYLSKVAASTGQDMDYMLDSLVTGVGRLSPMILDNLNIQASLSEATERAAEMFGVQASELTKTQTQAGMMAVVMEKLRANTAAMPDVTGSAAQQIAALGTKFQNLKDRIGMAVLPVLADVIGLISKLADAVIPHVITFIERIAEKIAFLAQAFRAGGFKSFFTTFEDGSNYVGGFLKMLGMGEEAAYGFGEMINQIVEKIAFLIEAFRAGGFESFFSTFEDGSNYVGGFLEVLGVGEETAYRFGEVINQIAKAGKKMIDWIIEFVSWKDVLIALGIAIASVVIPALVSIVSAAAPVIAVGAALVAAVVLVRSAWESNFLGIRDIVSVVQRAVQELWSKAKEFWEGFWSTFQPALESMHARLAQFYEEIQPKLQEAWKALQDAWDQVVALWREHLQPALNRLIEALGLGGEKTDELGSKVGALAGLLLSIELEKILNSIVAAVEAFTTAVNAVASAMEWWQSKIQAVRDALSGLELPSWLAPGSATPLELGIRGITDAMREWNAMSLGMPLVAGAGATSTTSHEYHFNMTVNTRASTSSVRQDFETMRALYGAR